MRRNECLTDLFAMISASVNGRTHTDHVLDTGFFISNTT
jgi:hypothetical protein